MSLSSLIFSINYLAFQQISELLLDGPILLTNNLTIDRRKKCQNKAYECIGYNFDKKQYHKLPGYACDCSVFICVCCGSDEWNEKENPALRLCFSCLHQLEERRDPRECKKCRKPLDPRFHRKDYYRSKHPHVRDRLHKKCWIIESYNFVDSMNSEDYSDQEMMI